jgi:hypothetical protein
LARQEVLELVLWKQQQQQQLGYVIMMGLLIRLPATAVEHGTVSGGLVTSIQCQHAIASPILIPTFLFFLAMIAAP